MVKIREGLIGDVPAMANIYNEAILHTVATFDLVEQTLEARTDWFGKYGVKYPLFVAEINGEVAGYSCLSPFREKDAFIDTTELSIYISPAFQGRGVGRMLMEEILKKGKSYGFHVIISGITGGNEVSVNLHKRFGFEFAGCLKEVGFKFDKWQDVHYYQLIFKD